LAITELDTISAEPLKSFCSRAQLTPKLMQNSLSWLPSGTFEPRRYKPGNIGNWSGHLPFARDLVVSTRPALVCELGTHLGESYFGFCQALSENNIPAVAYAVDTWMGEAQSGFYSEDVYKEVSAYNEANYSSFSYLVRSLFDNALAQFSDGSIDLLHIDGLHTYEAVSHDFYSWLPKLKPGGIVLLHDIMVRHSDFGVWKLWQEIGRKGSTFEFHHSWGLGVFENPGRTDARPDFLEALFGTETTKQEHIRRLYFLSALQLEWKHAIEGGALQSQDRDQVLQVYRPGPEGYREQESEKVRVARNDWQHVSVELQSGLRHGTVRIDPCDGPALIEVRGISLSSAIDRQVLWAAGNAEVSSLATGGTLVCLNGQLENGASRFFSYGADPQLYLPALDTKVFDQPVVLEIWIRLQTDLSGLLSIMERPVTIDRTAEVAELQSQIEAVRTELEAERGRLQQVLFDRENDQRQFEQQRVEYEDAKRQFEHNTREYEDEQLQFEQQRVEYENAKRQLERNTREYENERLRFDQQRRGLEKELQQLEGEKITASENLAICKLQLESLSRDLRSERELYEQQRLERELRDQEKQQASEQYTELKAQIEALQVENEQLLKETNKRQTQVYLLSGSQKEMKEIEKAYAELERKYKNMEQNFVQLEQTHRELAEEHKGLRHTFDNVLASQSWRLTAPLRGAMRLVKGRSSDRNGE
jgi:hypothetical protein